MVISEILNEAKPKTVLAKYNSIDVIVLSVSKDRAYVRTLSNVALFNDYCGFGFSNATYVFKDKLTAVRVVSDDELEDLEKSTRMAVIATLNPYSAHKRL